MDDDRVRRTLEECRSICDFIRNTWDGISLRDVNIQGLKRLDDILKYEEEQFMITSNNPCSERRTTYPIHDVIQIIFSHNSITEMLSSTIRLRGHGNANVLCAAMLVINGGMGNGELFSSLANDSSTLEVILGIIREPQDSAIRILATGCLRCVFDSPEPFCSTVDSETIQLLLSRFLSMDVPYVNGDRNVDTEPQMKIRRVLPQKDKDDYIDTIFGDESTLKKLELFYLLKILQVCSDEPSGITIPEKVSVDLLRVILDILRLSKEKRVIVAALDLLSSLLRGKRKFSALFMENDGVDRLLALDDIPYLADCLIPCFSSLSSWPEVLRRLGDLNNNTLSSVFKLVSLSAFAFESFHRLESLDCLTNFCGHEKLHQIMNRNNLLGGVLSILKFDGAEAYDAEFLEVVHATATLVRVSLSHTLLGVVATLVSSSTASIPDIDSPTFLLECLAILEASPSATVDALGPGFSSLVREAVDHGLVEKLLEVILVCRFERADEIAEEALDALAITAILPDVRGLISSSSVSSLRTGMSLIIGTADTHNWNEPGSIRAALQVVSICTYGFGESLRICRDFGGCWDWKLICNSIRNCEGIRVLLGRIEGRIPDAFVDFFRVLSCKAVFGLARDPTVLQILARLDLDGMFESVEQEERYSENGVAVMHAAASEGHIKQIRKEFLRCSRLLLARTGKQRMMSGGDVMKKLEKAAVLSQSRIQYSQSELLQIISSFLRERGLNNSADTLVQEAGLNPSDTTSGDFLDQLVTSYLMHQHRHCANPICVLPPLSLTSLHKCPVFRNYSKASRNVVNRIHMSEIGHRGGGRLGRCMNRSFLYSRFRHPPGSTIRGMNFSSIEFLESGVLMGTGTGSLVLYSLCGDMSAPKGVWTANDTWGVEEIRASRNRKHVLVQTYGYDGTLLYSHTDLDKPLLTIEGCTRARFHPTSNFLVGTVDHTEARIIDIETGKSVTTLHDSQKLPSDDAIACFSEHDNGNLILHGGTLWDFRSPPKLIHRFDQLSSHGTSLFHPFCAEAVVNSAVWDLKTLKLLKTSPELDKCTLRFSPDGSTIYGARLMNNASFSGESIFWTIDSSDYRTIKKTDVRLPICDFAPDVPGTSIGVIGGMDPVCVLFEVGEEGDEDGSVVSDDGLDDNEEDPFSDEDAFLDQGEVFLFPDEDSIQMDYSTESDISID